MSEKRILFVDHITAIGGAERSMIDLSRELTLKGYSCHFILPGEGALSAVLNGIGCVYIVPFKSWRYWKGSHLKLILSLPSQLIHVLRIIRLINKIKPAIIHFNINRLVEPLIAAWITKTPSVLHFRDIPSRMESKFLFGTNAFYWVMNRSTVWIANSGVTMKDIQPHARGTVQMVWNGIKPALFDKRSENIGYFSGGKQRKVLMIASLTPWKNILGYIQLAKIVKDLYKEEVLFFIAGTGTDPYRNTLESEVKRCEVSSVFNFLGQIDNIPSLLADVDVLVHTTINEPFGRVFVESMFARKPVVTFEGGGANEIVLHDVTGFLATPGNLTQMAEFVIDLLEDPAKRKDFGDQGYYRACEKFSLEAHVRAIEDVYNNVMTTR